MGNNLGELIDIIDKSENIDIFIVKKQKHVAYLPNLNFCVRLLDDLEDIESSIFLVILVDDCFSFRNYYIVLVTANS